MRKKSTTEEDISPRIVCTAPWRAVRVTSCPSYRLHVEFQDGTSGFVDLSRRVISPKAGVFASLADKTLFEQVYIHHGVVTWPGEIDLAPDAMYEAIKLHGEWVLT
jgi:CubicO group peptidase (beta-lactamase class C family)